MIDITDVQMTMDPMDDRESVRDFRNPKSSEQERQYVRQWWYEVGVKNQFHCMLVAAEVERRRASAAEPSLFPRCPAAVRRP